MSESATIHKPAETIWCLFSISNLYDQPDFNLEMWWKERPSIEMLCKAIGFTSMEDIPDDSLVAIVGVFKGETKTVDNVSYYIQEVVEGIKPPR